jgi:hypothetical protein
MVSLYLTAPEASFPDAAPASESVLVVMGEVTMPSMLVLRARRAAGWTRLGVRDLTSRRMASRRWKHC